MPSPASPSPGSPAPVDAVPARRRLPLIISVAVVVIVLDQLTKAWAVATLSDRDIDLFWTLRFHLERNSGAAFSLVRGGGGIIAIVALAVVVGLVWFGRSATSTLAAVAIGLILGGALGNIVDRFTRDGSAVVDFIDPQWYPIFNVADIGVSVGAAILILSSLRGDGSATDGP